MPFRVLNGATSRSRHRLEADASTWKPRFAGYSELTSWSKPNKERVECLIAAGLMTPAGLAKAKDLCQARLERSW